MKKITAIFNASVLIFFVFALNNACRRELPVPHWVQEAPQNTDSLVYFVGKSERSGNYHNYLEAKADALVDVLVQFALYTGATIEDVYRDYRVENIEDGSLTATFTDSNTQMVFTINSAGLYQQSEWMDRDGILYVLYSFPVDGSTHPRPDIPEFWRNHQFDIDRIYFTARAVSAQNADNLAHEAQQSAQLQAFIWLGADISGNFTDYYASDEFNPEIALDNFEGTFYILSSVDMQSIDVREEANRRTREGNRHHYYGLFSISTAALERIPAYNYLSYFIIYGRGDGDSRDIFAKQISINNDFFFHDAPFVSLSGVAEGLPGGIRERLSTSEDILSGIGTEKNASMQVQNIRAAMRAVTVIARAIDSQVQEIMTENEEEQYREYISAITSSLNTSGVFRYYDVLHDDNSSWQIWHLAR